MSGNNSYPHNTFLQKVPKGTGGVRNYAAGSDSKYRYFRQFASALPIIRIMCRDVCSENGRGSRTSFMSFNSCSNWLPLRRLQSLQHATRFSHVDNPP